MMAIPNEVDLWCRILEKLSHHHNHHNMVMQYSLSINTVYQLDTTILSARRNGSFLYLRNSHRGQFQESPFRIVVTSLSATCLNLYRSLAHLTHITYNINSHYLLLQACLQLLTTLRLSFQTNHQSHRRRRQAS